MKRLLILTIIVLFSVLLTACGNSKPNENVLKEVIISKLGDNVKFEDFKIEKFESKENNGTATCSAKYEKNAVSVEKIFVIECEKKDNEWTANRISEEQLKKATPISGVDENEFIQNSQGWDTEISDHKTDLDGLKEELTITMTSEKDGVKSRKITKKKFAFKGESWDEISSDEVLNTVEPTKGVLDNYVLNSFPSGKIINHQTDLENKKDTVIIEQAQENAFFKKIITTSKEYEFQESNWKEVTTEATHKIENINLIGNWTGKEVVTSALSKANGTYDITLNITELGSDGQIKGEIKSRIGNFNFESKLEKEQTVFFKTSFLGNDFRIETGSDNKNLKIWGWNYGGVDSPPIEVDGLVKNK